jgi:2,5-dioxopentanoate dehydrogenase
VNVRNWIVRNLNADAVLHSAGEFYMSYIPHGKHLIAGAWVGGQDVFDSEPADGAGYQFSVGVPDDISRACNAAAEAFISYGIISRKKRAAFLNMIADEIEQRGELITAIGSNETGYPKIRLESERARTEMQLRFFANTIIKGDYLDRRHDVALPDRRPLPRHELRTIQRPVGPVGVFGASNFPLAFSTAGGDAAAAFAAGCPVVVKGHSAHPGTGEIVAEAIDAAIRKCDMHPGVFSMIQGGSRDVGQALVMNHNIKAIGFTGSTAGGRALFNLACTRTEPIPFFGELGSVNPMFLMPDAVKTRSAEIAAGWAASLTMGAGQFCTNPGVAILIAGEEAEQFSEAARKALVPINEQVMLTSGIAEAFRSGQKRIAGITGVKELLSVNCKLRKVAPALYNVSGDNWLANAVLEEEVFGPLGIIVEVRDFDQMKQIARRLDGQLTCTLHLDDDDIENGRQLIQILEHKAGRLLANGFPTGVEVCDSMVHGGPYPASTNFGATSVGSLSIRRFLRPVCYQNMPQELLPLDFQG